MHNAIGKRWCKLVGTAVFLAVAVGMLRANPPADSSVRSSNENLDANGCYRLRKSIDMPNPADYRKVRQRQRLREQLRRMTPEQRRAASLMESQLQSLTQTGTSRVLVILVEFAGTNHFVWTNGASYWDPVGLCDSAEYDGVNVGNAAASTFYANLRGIATTTNVIHAGPLHNQIARPLSATDRSGDMIWVEDFNRDYYDAIIFGNGIVFNYQRQDGSTVYEDFTGASVNNFYRDMSGGAFSITGQVIGWLQVTNSMFWYGADLLPGARSGTTAGGHNGGILGAGNARTLVQHALEAVKAAYPSFDWAYYDQDGDGVIDRLWIIHAGLGEEDSTELLNRTTYGEGALWSHSSTLAPFYEVVPGISAGPYIMMPENSGIAVLAHEFGHNIGADDLYAYDMGETSAGFWTTMADDWTGYPIGYLPPAFDPWHLDNWGWLNPLTVSDPTRVYEVTLGQTSQTPDDAGVYRGVRIELPDRQETLAVQPTGAYQWWGGAENNAVGAMVLTGQTIAIPGGGATLELQMTYDIEQDYDFCWIQASSNGGVSWVTLTNANTTSDHASDWIGGLYGFPDDLSAAGIAGFSGTAAGWPSYQTETFSLNRFAGKDIVFRFWYMTDTSVLEAGPFIERVVVKNGSTIIFSNDADVASTLWEYTDPWEVNNGNRAISHNYYIQWRNVATNGGYDRCLGESRWRFGPANSGMLVWYNDNYYLDNEIAYYLNDAPGFGPKGRMLVVDAHSEPYRDPYWVAYGFSNEGANVSTRSLMRDAPFSISDTVNFTMDSNWCASNTAFEGRPGVATFSDSLGYYPGAEYVRRSPAQATNIWLTKQWDASVVLPASNSYGIKAPGYTAATPFRYCGWRSGNSLSAYWYSTGLGYDGSSGNPSEVNGDYGWNAKVIEQSDTYGRIVIWNSKHVGSIAANDDAFAGYAGRTRHIAAPGVLSNDVGPVGATLLAELLTAPAHGTVALDADGGFVYTPEAGYLGTDSFTYRCYTYYGATSTPATVSIDLALPPSQAVAGDFDGDRKADPAVYQEFYGKWKARFSGASYTTVEAPAGFFGNSGWDAIAGDFDGDGKADPALYHAETGAWQVRCSGRSYAVIDTGAGFLGGADWTAVAGDFDGDGKADPAVYNAGTGAWQVRCSGRSYTVIDTGAGFLGGADWTAVAGDFDGDGKADPAIYNVGTGAWQVRCSGRSYAVVPSGAGFLGETGWVAGAGDFDGDGKADPFVYDAATASWKIRLSAYQYVLRELTGFLGF